MNGIAEILALLTTVAQLLTFISANPGSVSPEARANALRLTEQAITLAKTTIARHQQPTPSPIIPTPRPIAPRPQGVLPKPDYDLLALEQRVHQLINNERARLILRPLTLDERISQVARAHSQDQAYTNSRTTPTQKPCVYPAIRHEGITDAGVGLADRLNFNRVPFRSASENIVLLSTARESMYRAPSAITCPAVPTQEIPQGATLNEARRIVFGNIAAAETVLARIPEVEWVRKSWHDLETIAQRAVTGWIESPGHHANITNEHFALTGIGAAEVNRYIIITQVFVER